MLHASHAFLPPELVERFAIGAPIGVGGQATVYRGRHRDGRPCAVKVFRDEVGDGVDARRIDEECRSLDVLAGRRGVVEIHESGVIEGVAFIAMELFDASLAERIASLGALSVDEATEIVRSLATTLAHVHNAGVVHGDVKPSNVFIGDDGSVVLGDFGTSRRVVDRTITGSFAMSMAFAAPELLEAGETSVATDVYALGATAYQLLSGRLPFADDAVGSTSMAGIGTYLRRIEREAPAPLDLAVVPPDLSTLVLQMMAKSPDARPSSAAEVAARLNTIASGGSPPDAAATNVRWMPSAAVRRSVALAACTAAVGVLVVSWALGRETRPAEGAVDVGAVEVVNAVDDDLFQPSGDGSSDVPATRIEARDLDSTPDDSLGATGDDLPVVSTTIAATTPVLATSPVEPGEELAASTPEAQDALPPVATEPAPEPRSTTEVPSGTTTVAPTTAPPVVVVGPCGDVGVLVCEAFEGGLDDWTLRTEGDAEVAPTDGAAFGGAAGLSMRPGVDVAGGSAFIRRPVVMPTNEVSTTLVFRVRFESVGSGEWFTNVASLRDESDSLWNVDARSLADGSIALSLYHQDADGFSDGGAIDSAVEPGEWQCVRLDISPEATPAARLSLVGDASVEVDAVPTELGSVYSASIGSAYISPQGAPPEISYDDVSVGSPTAVSC